MNPFIVAPRSGSKRYPEVKSEKQNTGFYDLFYLFQRNIEGHAVA